MEAGERVQNSASRAPLCFSASVLKDSLNPLKFSVKLLSFSQ